MKRLSKILAVIICFVLTLSCVACSTPGGSGGEDNSNRTVVKLYVGGGGFGTKPYEEQAKRFREHTSGKSYEEGKMGAAVEVIPSSSATSITLNSGLLAEGYHRGLFFSNSSERNGGIFNNYKMTNVLVEVSEEVFNGVVELSFGTIMSRDHLIGLRTPQERSARFANVVTISRASPIVYRQTIGGEYANEWGENGIYMHFVYAENEVGKVGLGYKQTHASTEAVYPHNPVKEDGPNGSYILNNVYRYDNISEVDSEKVDTFIETGLWKIMDGKLSWAKAPLKAEATEDNGNFNPDWLDKIQ